MALTQETISKIVMLRGVGCTQQEVADELKISRKTVETYLRKLRVMAEESIEKGTFDEFYFTVLFGRNLSLLKTLFGIS